MSAAISIRDLHFTYPDGREALKGAALDLEPGERVAILGPNGAGKTTLALNLNGIYQPDQGSVFVGGLEVVEENYSEVRRRVGLVFQDSNDQLFMPTVSEDVAFGPANLGIAGSELEDRVATALAAVGGEELADRPAHHLSGGERRKVALATVLSMNPDVLVFDEPTSGLDPAGRSEFVASLQPLPMTMLVITHDLSLALQLCERSVIMRDGRIVADRPTSEILADQQLLAANRLELPYGFSLSV